eukprot:m.201867 g.201867  ORF g.201867 m.201867 type:complete len:58 (-) comp32806_c11_seq2:176-349(-)
MLKLRWPLSTSTTATSKPFPTLLVCIRLNVNVRIVRHANPTTIFGTKFTIVDLAMAM